MGGWLPCSCSICLRLFSARTRSKIDSFGSTPGAMMDDADEGQEKIQLVEFILERCHTMHPSEATAGLGEHARQFTKRSRATLGCTG